VEDQNFGVSSTSSSPPLRACSSGSKGLFIRRTNPVSRSISLQCHQFMPPLLPALKKTRTHAFFLAIVRCFSASFSQQKLPLFSSGQILCSRQACGVELSSKLVDDFAVSTSLGGLCLWRYLDGPLNSKPESQRAHFDRCGLAAVVRRCDRSRDLLGIGSPKGPSRLQPGRLWL
jgi:hypothetical protein